MSGLSTRTWDDSLARLSLGFDTYATSILAAGSQIAIVVPSGNVVLYISTVFLQAKSSPIKHGERIDTMELTNSGTLLVTSGYSTIKIWDTSTGNCARSVRNIESRPRLLTMRFVNDNTMLIVGTDDRRIRSLDLNQTEPAWKLVVELEKLEIEDNVLYSASYITLNEDASLIAVAYREYAFSVWETNGPVHISHFWRKHGESLRGEVIQACWHPHRLEILGLYSDGVSFK